MICTRKIGYVILAFCLHAQYAYGMQTRTKRKAADEETKDHVHGKNKELETLQAAAIECFENRDYKQALFDFEIISKYNDLSVKALAWYYLGRIYYYTAQYNKALEFIELAIDQTESKESHWGAKCYKAKMLYHGVGGFKKDPVRAFELFEAVAHPIQAYNKCAQAQASVYLARMYIYGNTGEIHFGKATKCLQSAEHQEDSKLARVVSFFYQSILCRKNNQNSVAREYIVLAAKQDVDERIKKEALRLIKKYYPDLLAKI